jgi:hypothetical protein
MVLVITFWFKGEYCFTVMSYDGFVYYLIFRSHGSWNFNYLSDQCISPLTLWVRTTLRRCVLDTTLCDNFCQWLATGRWFSSVTPVSSANKTDRHDKTEICGVEHHKSNQTPRCTWGSTCYSHVENTSITASFQLVARLRH